VAYGAFALYIQKNDEARVDKEENVQDTIPLPPPFFVFILFFTFLGI